MGTPDTEEDGGELQYSKQKNEEKSVHSTQRFSHTSPLPPPRSRDHNWADILQTEKLNCLRKKDQRDLWLGGSQQQLG